VFGAQGSPAGGERLEALIAKHFAAQLGTYARAMLSVRLFICRV
jgi:hypothetical protein